MRKDESGIVHLKECSREASFFILHPSSFILFCFMIIGIPKEIKNHEYRVGLLPVNAQALVDAGHTVLVEKNAGVGSGAFDPEYREAGARIVNSAREIWRRSDMIVKVKEPQPVEVRQIRAGQIVFTYFHVAA